MINLVDPLASFVCNAFDIPEPIYFLLKRSYTYYLRYFFIFCMQIQMDCTGIECMAC